jgi:hypothetical protein
VEKEFVKQNLKFVKVKRKELKMIITTMAAFEGLV